MINLTYRFFFMVLILPGTLTYGMFAVKWQPGNKDEAAGYKVYIGLEPGQYQHCIDVGNSNLYLIKDFADTTLFICVTAYNREGTESAKSREISIAMPLNYALAQRPRLYPVYPNPHQGKTRIACYLPEKQSIQLCIYNTAGQKINTLWGQQTEAGLHTWHWHGRDFANRPVASGTYIVTLRYQKYCISRKMIMAK